MESLLRQFGDNEYHVVGLQETRSRLLGHQETMDFHVLSHPADPLGHGGVQLWIRSKWCNELENIHIQTHHLDILHGDPQLLIVKVHKGSLKMIFIVAHAPNSGDLTEYSAYWDHVMEEIPPELRKWTVILLADANARLGPNTDLCIGPNSEDTENDRGGAFRRWLNEHDLCPPSTWNCHIGTTFTWTHSRGTHQARLDYVVLPRELLPNVQCSWVDDQVDLTLKRPDHQVTTISLLWHRPGPSQEGHKKPPRIHAKQFRDHLPWLIQTGYRTEATLEVANHDKGDIHTHAHHFWQRAQWLQQWFRNPHQRPQRNPHLSEDTWTMICDRNEQWQTLRYLRYQRKQLICSAIWKAWRGLTGWKSDIEDDFQWKKHLAFNIARKEHDYTLCNAQTVTAMRQDDRRFYQKLSDKAKDTEGQPGKLWQIIKPMLPKHVQARQSNTRCRGPSITQLHAHFDHLEAAKHLSYDELLQSCRERQHMMSPQIPPLLSVRDLPSRSEIEKLCRKVKPDKSPGVDGIEGGLFKYGADLIGEALHDLFLRAWTTGAEPVQWKGGLTVPIWKRRGNPKTAETYRGITLLDGAAKRWHALLRQRFLQTVRPHKPLGQLGGFPHQQTGYASLYLRSISESTKQRIFQKDTCSLTWWEPSII